MIIKEGINYNSGCLDATARRTVIVGRKHDICLSKSEKQKEKSCAGDISFYLKIVLIRRFSIV